jgi:hypothetical protein
MEWSDGAWGATYNRNQTSVMPMHFPPTSTSTSHHQPIWIVKSGSNVNSTIHPTSSNTTPQSQKPQICNLPCYIQVMYIPASGTLKAIIGPFRSKDRLVTTQPGYETGNYPKHFLHTSTQNPVLTLLPTVSGVALSLLAIVLQLTSHWYGGQEVAVGIARSLFCYWFYCREWNACLVQ